MALSDYIRWMKPTAIPAEKLEEDSSPPEPGYDSWKRRKIESAKAQARDRESLIPAEQVWRDLGLER